MIKLEQYKDSIHKCSKCGLCQEVCPIYRENGNECATARGVLILLKGIISKELSLKRNSAFYLDKCLRCGKCSQVCPSEIPIEDIIFVAKQKMLYSTLNGLFKRILQSRFVMNMFSKPKKLNSLEFEKKTVYIGANAQEVVKILNNNNIQVLNSRELDWGKEYLLAGNLVRFRQNFKCIINQLIVLKPDFIVTDIPEDSFRQLVQKYTNHEFNIKIIYLGDFVEAESYVSKFYNPQYASAILEKIK